jgi:hypothetical protein
LFRPEFIKYYYRPLCPDSFSGFIDADPHQEKHNQEIVEATKHLIEDILPGVGIHLADLVVAAKQKGQIASLPLTETLHSKGMNMRLLGLLIQHFPKEPKFELCTSIILAEAVVRVIKYFTRFHLRERMKRFQEPLRTSPYINTVIDYTNLVFGSSEASDHHWNVDIKNQLKEKFSFGPPFTSPEYNLKAVLDELYNPDFDETATFKLLVFARFQLLTGIRFTDIAIRKFESLCRGRGRGGSGIAGVGSGKAASTSFGISGSSWLAVAAPFDSTDLESLGEHVKHMGIMNDSQGSFYFYKGMACKSSNDISTGEPQKNKPLPLCSSFSLLPTSKP